jgi:2-polyprenyl-3-methyl-5-hydroxy-6-metoxy-1,4-benzoquinol methylase
MKGDIDKYYKIKPDSYFSGYREDLFRIVSEISGLETILEIGCGSGGLISELKKTGIASFVVGVEPFGEKSETSDIDLFIKSNVEDVLNLLPENQRYDLIIFGDVLEHLIDPWTILKNITDSFLSENGYVLISIPNIRNFMSLYKIIFMRSFKYESEGVFDKTHLRFFCLTDILHLVHHARLVPIKVTQNYKYKSSIFFSKNRLKYLNGITLNLFPTLWADQIIVLAKKNNK